MQRTMTCAHDVDCVSPLVCFANVSWTEEPFCGCSNWYGWRSDFQDVSERQLYCNVLGPTTILLVVSALIRALVSFWLFLVAWADVFALQLERRKRLEMNASITTLLSTTLGITFFLFWTIFYLFALTLPSTYTRFDKNGTRESVLNVWTRWLILGTQLFAASASLNVSVVWVEVSQQTRHLSPKMVRNVSKYRRACLAFGVLFTVVMLGAAVTGNVEATPVLAIPFLFVLAVTFFVGRRQMVTLLKDIGKNAKVGAGKEKTGKAVAAIRACSTKVILAMLGIVIFGFAYFIGLVVPEGGWRELNGNGPIYPAALVAEPVAHSMLLLLWSVFWYTHRTLSKQLYRPQMPQKRTSSCPLTAA